MDRKTELNRLAELVDRIVLVKLRTARDWEHKGILEAVSDDGTEIVAHVRLQDRQLHALKATEYDVVSRA